VPPFSLASRTGRSHTSGAYMRCEHCSHHVNGRAAAPIISLSSADMPVQYAPDLDLTAAAARRRGCVADCWRAVTIEG
jgi:hypothetical protein